MGSIEEILGEFATTPIEPYIDELKSSRELPNFAVALCAVRYQDSGPFLRAALERAANGTLTDKEDERLFFRGLFIVGGRRDPLGFEPLLHLLRRPADEVEYLLKGVITEDLPGIAAGMFNGDADALLDAIVDQRLDEYVRESLLGAAAFLTWDGRIDRDRMIAFLRRFDEERLAPDADQTWYGWLQAIALLGLRELEPAVMAAWDRGAIPPGILARHHFMEDLERSEQAPEDIQRFKDVSLGYIEDVVVALKDWTIAEDEKDDDLLDAGSLGDDWPMTDEGQMTDEGPITLPGQPTINPWRHVGRNDPCPCGSGKKAKRCCLAA